MAQRLSLRLRVVATLTVCGLLIGASTAVLVTAARTAKRGQERASDAIALRFQATRAEKLILDVETGERGFLLTRENAFLEPWQSARRAFPQAARKLVASSRADKVANDLALRIQRLGQDYIQDYNEPLVRRARRNLRAAQRQVAAGEGKWRVDVLRDLFRRFIAQQTLVVDASLEQASEALDRAVRVAIICLGGAVPLFVLIGLALGPGVLGSVSRLRETAGQLERGELEARAPEAGPPELAALARAFNSMASALEESRAVLVSRAAELERATAAAEAANRAKSEFLARMSHELRTPLNAILGFGQLLEMNDLTADDADSTRQILRAGRHLLALVDEVLDLARIEAGKLRVSMEPVALGPLLEEVDSLVRPLAAPRSIAMSLETGTRFVVLADRQRLKQIVLNLVSNAIKYNREGGSVTVSVTSPTDARVRIEVADTGPGIAEEEMSVLFEPFERLGADDTVVQGSGLGLAVSRRLAELMEGELGVRSQIGGGSTFYLELGEAGGASAGYDPGEDDGSTRSERRRVLCVDDNPSNTALVERVLARRPDVEVIPAATGRLALALAAEHPLDLVLLDVNLPDMSGFDVLKQLRAEPGTARVPVIVISAGASEREVRTLRAAGVDRFLDKPLDIQELLRAVDQLGDTEAPRSDAA